jgi:general secretion pathway protein K
MRPGSNLRARGGALLAVLWLSAALGAVAFSVANTVRGETERASTALDSARAYFLATGAIERALLWIQWGAGIRNPDGSPRFWDPTVPVRRMEFPTGEAIVELIPDSSRLSINHARPEEILRLLLALGVAPDRAQEITAAIIDWRTPLPPAVLSPFDPYYLSLTPSFRARHASFLETEELLFVKGMTPEIYHGSYGRDEGGRLFPRGALKNCVSVFGSTGAFEVNAVEPALMAAIGLSPEAIRLVLEMRRRGPIRTPEQMALIAQVGGPAAQRLRLGSSQVFTLRATARVRQADGRLSDLRRSVAATFRTPADYKEDILPYRVLRWYDNVWVDERRGE